MGAMQRLKESELDRKRTARAGNKYSGAGNTDGDTAWGVGSCDNEALASTIELVLRAGDGISFYRARSGNAVCTTVLSGDERFKFWSANVDELTDTLERIRAQAGEFLNRAP